MCGFKWLYCCSYYSNKGTPLSSTLSGTPSRGSYCVVFITNITDSIVYYLLCCTHSTAGDCVWHALASRHFFLFSALWGLMLCAVVKSPEIFCPRHFGLACKILLKLFLNCLLFNQNVKLTFIVVHRLTKIWGAIEGRKISYTTLSEMLNVLFFFYFIIALFRYDITWSIKDLHLKLPNYHRRMA